MSHGMNLFGKSINYSEFPRAVLLTGVPGVGKKTLSMEWAKGLLCRGNEQERPCGKCRSCRRIQKGIDHENLIYLTLPKDRKTIGIKAVTTNIIDRIAASSLESGNRVVLVHNADCMTPQAQNALLKTLEEPPDENTYFILTADRLYAILTTIVSRCTVIHAPLWNAEEIRDTLIQKGHPADLAARVSKMAGGSIGNALSMCDSKQAVQADETVAGVFLNVKDTRGIQEALSVLKGQKDMDQAELKALQQRLALLISLRVRGGEETLSELFDSEWITAPIRSLQRIFDCVLETARYRASNVSWLTEAENILRVIVEERAAWQS